MAETTNWGDVTLDIQTKERELLSGGVIRQVQCATEEDLADWAPKAFPAVVIIWKGATIEKRVTVQSNHFAVMFRGRWELHHYCSTGQGDEVGMFSEKGVFAVSQLTREKLLGYSPLGQKHNSALLMPDGEGEIQRFSGGSGGMKLILPYVLDQAIWAILA